MRTSGAGCPGVSFTRRAGHRRAACAAALRLRPSSIRAGIACGSVPAFRHRPAAWRFSGSPGSPSPARSKSPATPASRSATAGVVVATTPAAARPTVGGQALIKPARADAVAGVVARRFGVPPCRTQQRYSECLAGRGSGDDGTSRILGDGRGRVGHRIGVTTWAGSPVWPAAIPLGDGKVTTTCPRVGYVYPCASQFRGAGARHSGSWINTAAGTWNAKAKLHGAGANSQPDASHSFTVSGANRILKTSDLPAGATTGNFPVAPSDPACRYDTNPNHVVARSFDQKGPATPPRPVLRAAAAWADRGPGRRGGLLRCP